MIPYGERAELSLFFFVGSGRIDDGKYLGLAFGGHGGVSFNSIPEILPGSAGGTDRDLTGKFGVLCHYIIVNGLAALLGAEVVNGGSAVGSGACDDHDGFDFICAATIENGLNAVKNLSVVAEVPVNVHRIQGEADGFLRRCLIVGRDFVGTSLNGVISKTNFSVTESTEVIVIEITIRLQGAELALLGVGRIVGINDLKHQSLGALRKADIGHNSRAKCLPGLCSRLYAKFAGKLRITTGQVLHESVGTAGGEVEVVVEITLGRGVRNDLKGLETAAAKDRIDICKCLIIREILGVNHSIVEAIIDTLSGLLCAYKKRFGEHNDNRQGDLHGYLGD